jgi:hypothetical protein
MRAAYAGERTFSGAGSRLSPCLPQLLAVEDEEEQRDEEKYSFVERPRDGEKSEGRQPADRPRNALVADHDPHRPRRSPYERPQ